MRPIITAALLCVSLSLAAVVPAQAQKRPGGGQTARPDFGQSQPSAGLTVRFADGAACTPISSPYASPTRYDGSKRPTGGVEGDNHGGIDLSLEIGTPLLAVAPGRVYMVGVGGMLEGIYIWLIHLPADTGLPFAVLSKYQHLDEKPAGARGDRVALGQVIGRSGKTGTVGGYYGPNGYPHLHLTMRAIHDDKLGTLGKPGEFAMNRDTTIIDPLTIYVPGVTTPTAADALAADAKRLTVAHVDGSGMIQPSAARFVWPVTCQ